MLFTQITNIKQRSDFSLKTKSTWNPKLAKASEAYKHPSSSSLCSRRQQRRWFSRAVPPLSTVPLQFYLSHRRASKHSSSSLFDLFSIDEELIIVMFQKLKNNTTLQLNRNSLSISFWSLFNWRGTTWHRSTSIPWCSLKFIVRLVKCVIYYFDIFLDILKLFFSL